MTNLPLGLLFFVVSLKRKFLFKTRTFIKVEEEKVLKSIPKKNSIKKNRSEGSAPCGQGQYVLMLKLNKRWLFFVSPEQNYGYWDSASRIVLK